MVSWAPEDGAGELSPAGDAPGVGVCKREGTVDSKSLLDSRLPKIWACDGGM